jgi:hypothetical protein
MRDKGREGQDIGSADVATLADVTGDVEGWDKPKDSVTKVHEAWMDESVTGGELVDPGTAQVSIVSRIMEAETEDDILSAGGAKGPDDLGGQAFLIRNVVARKGDFGNLSVFLVLTLRMKGTNAEDVITIGSENVLAQVRRLKDKGLIPSETYMRFERRETGGGFHVYYLRKA